MYLIHEFDQFVMAPSFTQLFSCNFNRGNSAMALITMDKLWNLLEVLAIQILEKQVKNTIAYPTVCKCVQTMNSEPIKKKQCG